MDAKKSPLALLAQTCNSIGAPDPPGKSLIPPIEKKDKKSSSPSGHSDEKLTFKPYETKRDEGSGSASPKSGLKSPGSTKSEKDSVKSPRLTPSREKLTSPSSALSTSSATVDTVTTSQNQNRISLGCGNMFVDIHNHEHLKDSAAAFMHGHKHSLGLPGLTPNCTGCLGVPVDAAGAAPSMPGALTAHGLTKPGSSPTAATPAMSPYVAYARVKTAAGGSTLVPICRDPYCTNCQLSLHSAQLAGPCPSGCTQCNHEVVSAAAAAASLSFHPGYPYSSSSLSSGLPANYPFLYPHILSHASPFVCNWISGSEYCGKRFQASEELLQHLRTHTATASEVPPPSLSQLSALNCHLHYSQASSLTGSTMNKSYPSSLAPSMNSLAASRYHPYSRPLAGLSSSALGSLAHPGPGIGAGGLGTTGLAGLNPYFSPYAALYSQRLGVAGAHP